MTVTALVASASLAAPAAHATTFGAINEFSSGLNAGSSPYGVAPGPDGAVWFTDHGVTAAIGRAGPGGISESSSGLPSGAAPYNMTPGLDGNTWFLDEGSATTPFARVTPSGAINEFGNGLQSNSDPDGFTTAPDGSIWFTDSGSPAAVGRLKPCTPLPCTPTIQEFTSGLIGNSPFDIAPGPDGNFWFRDSAGSIQYIGRVTPSGHIDEFPVGTFPSVALAVITPGPDGNVYFTDTAGAVGRVIPCSPLPCTPNIHEFPVIAGRHPGYGIATGPDGGVWFTDQAATSMVGRIAPCAPLPSCTPSVNYFSSGLSSSSDLWSIAPSADGNMWFADSGLPAIGLVGTGAPAASHTAPALSGSGRAGTPQSCGGQTWSSWLGQQPSLTLSRADGYQWLNDGAPIAGATSPTYVPTGAEAGHQLSCRVTATYGLPLFVTAVSSSAGIRVLAPAVKISKSKVSRKAHSAKFTFHVLGTTSGVQCALVHKKGKGKHKKSKPHFTSCKSPKTYKHLKPGRYTFEVRAATAAGPGPAAIKSIRFG